MFGLLFALGLFAIYQSDPDEFRAGYDEMFKDFPVDPEATITEVDAGGVRSLLVQIGSGRPERHVVYFHGGGLMCGNPEGVRGTAALLARAAKAAVLVPDYRLAPENAFPAAAQDAVTAVRWVLSEGGATRARVLRPRWSVGRPGSTGPCRARPSNPRPPWTRSPAVSR
jgi:acetyl esterase/lipase